MNHYPRHVGDITRDTFGLSLTEFGAYDRLLDAYYATEKPLPLDAKERYRMAGAVSKADRAAVDYIVRRYFALEADGWHQKRCDEEIAAYQERADIARKNGANGGRPRNPRETKSVISGNPERTQAKANQEPEPVTNNQGEAKPTRARPAVAALPDWLPPEVWQKWAKHRGQKLTPQAIALQLGKLDALRKAGFDVASLIDLAIESGWATFYPPRAAGGVSKHTERQKVAEQIFGATNERHDSRVIDGEAERVA